MERPIWIEDEKLCLLSAKTPDGFHFKPSLMACIITSDSGSNRRYVLFQSTGLLIEGAQELVLQAVKCFSAVELVKWLSRS